MEFTPVIVAALAAGAILLIFLGLAGGSSVDPVQARLTQLGTMEAANLEELELQQPFVERTLRPLAARLSGSVARITSSSFSERTEKRLALQRQRIFRFPTPWALPLRARRRSIGRKGRNVWLAWPKVTAAGGARRERRQDGTAGVQEKDVGVMSRQLEYEPTPAEPLW